MVESVRCSECNSAIEENWRVCAFCGISLAAQTQNPPPLVENAFRSQPSPTPDAQRDQSTIGLGLAVLGVLVFIGGIALLFSGAFSSFASFDGIVVTFSSVGGIAILLVIVGAIVHSSASSGQNASSGVMGGLLAVMMTLCMGALTVLAMIIFAIQSCFRALGG